MNQVFMQFISKRRNLLIVGVVLLLLLSVFAIVRNEQRKKGLEPKITSYYDADSGQTVTDIEGKTPESDGADPDKPRMLGFQDLLNAGVTKYQLDSIQNAFTTYAKQNKIKEVSIKVSTIKTLPHNKADGIKTTTEFQVKFDRKTVYYKTSAIATGVSRIQVVLYDSSGNQVFDSGVLYNGPS